MDLAIGLVRVSTDKQGASLEAQEEKIRAWCTANDYHLINIYKEAGTSGCAKIDKRQELKKALNEVCEKSAALIVYSLSRLSRSTKDTILISERLHRANADLISLTERIDTTSAAGKMLFNLMSVLHEFEVEQLKECITNSMSHLRKNNKRISRVIPFGYDLKEDGKGLAVNDMERYAIERMKELRISGNSLRKIASSLENLGIKTKTGTKWSAPVIKGILDRERKIA